MDHICRLCCSSRFVNNYIFDEEKALFLKMSLYLPIKVFKDDHLPQKICDKCSCKVNDIYQFCNEIITVQNKLKSVVASSKFLVSDVVNLTVTKQYGHSAPLFITHCNQSTQTDTEFKEFQVKDEPNTQVPLPPVKKEEDLNDDDNFIPDDIPSGDSEEEFLIDIKKKKKETTKSEVKQKRGRKPKMHLENAMLDIIQSNGLTVVDEQSIDMDLVKEELEVKHSLDDDFDMDSIDRNDHNEELLYCCMCFMQFNSRMTLLKHYRDHGRKNKVSKVKPTPPSPPPGDSPRCPRCQKILQASEWVKHWRRHFDLDTRPYRCALCESTYRDHHKMLKHGLTHKPEEFRSEAAHTASKRFFCDICPESFVYMRCMLSHRTLSHPEAAARALSLRCGVCARTFAHPNSLRRHALVHSGERNHLCNVCGKALSSREHLKFHIRIHTGYKPNVCKTCGKGFVKRCNLKLHERVHSGEKPHVCSHCGKAFSQRSTLVIHERYHSGARPFSCTMCGRGFVARGLLTMHLKTACVDVPRQRPAPPPPPPLLQKPAKKVNSNQDTAGRSRSPDNRHTFRSETEASSGVVYSTSVTCEGNDATSDGFSCF